ncbi:hypothetical protein Areg01_03940 [Actinoplanes regularis]|nr:hypothetical protein Areg01_03940 [Actinoplanes regularis]
MPEVSLGAARSRRWTLRAVAGNGAVPALLTTAYAGATWSSPNRGLILLVAVVSALTGALLWVLSDRLAWAPRAWMAALLTGAAVNLAGGAVLGLLDGGVAGPFGALVPGAVVLLATVLSRRVFPVVAGFSLLAYGAVVLWGEPAPAGYVLVNILAFAGSATLCRRHIAVLSALRRRLADGSRTDPLTGCLNRRGFDRRLAAELAGAERAGSPVTLVLLDLDHFKTVNDRDGHQAGDDLLVWTGRELSACGTVGRLGGDEFALLLTGSDVATAVDRIRERMRLYAPASLGFATFPADAADASELYAAADRKLYADKAARDRHAPAAEAVAAVRTDLASRAAGPSSPKTPKTGRKRHAIADPGWMAMAQTSVAAVYVLLFTAGNPHRTGMIALCAWGFLTGLALVAAAGWLSGSRLARPLMLAFAVSSFVSCGAIAILDGGVSGVLGIGILLAIPLLMLGMRPAVAGPVAVTAVVLYALVAVIAGGAGFWYVLIHLVGTGVVAVATAMLGRTAAQQRRRLTELSRTDVLTDVLNRRGFAEGFAAAPAHALLLFDLDGFKQLNDTHGHAAGDELLRWVAGTLRASVHPRDLVARLGGDEFVVLLREAGSATSTAERLQAALGERTAASVGVAVVGLDGTDFDRLYAVADSRLYADKSLRGRASTAATSATTQSAERLRKPARNEPVVSFTAPSA